MLKVKVFVPIKYLRNLCRFLDLPLINCEIELDLAWSRDFKISEILSNVEFPVNATIYHLPEVSTADAALEINSIKLYFPVVTFPRHGNIKF